MSGKDVKKMNKYQEALQKIIDNYDAYFMGNRHGIDNTHESEFKVLSALKGEYVQGAIEWIKLYYDCFYKDFYLGEEDNAILYLQRFIEEFKDE